MFAPELEAAALQVEGVEFLEGLRVSVADGDDWQELEPPTLDLETYEVVQLAEVSVVAGNPASAGRGHRRPRPGRPRRAGARPSGGLLMRRPR